LTCICADFFLRKRAASISAVFIDASNVFELLAEINRPLPDERAIAEPFQVDIPVPSRNLKFGRYLACRSY
jgi:hypothetical protein